MRTGSPIFGIQIKVILGVKGMGDLLLTFARARRGPLKYIDGCFHSFNRRLPSGWQTRLREALLSSQDYRFGRGDVREHCKGFYTVLNLSAREVRKWE